MFSKTSERIANGMVDSGSISSDDKEVYLFGIQQGLSTLLNLVTMIIFGLLFGVLLGMVIFTVAYSILRSYAGGYHAKTPNKCYMLSSTMTASVAFMLRFAALDLQFIIGILLFAGAFIMIVSPVGTKSKPLDKIEKKVYKKMSVLICAIQIVAVMISLFFGIYFIAMGVFWAIVMVCILVSVEKLLQKE